MKKIGCLLLVIVIGIIGFISYKKLNVENSSLTKIKVAEVTHSIFYAPFYVAIENGYFEELGIDIELILTPGADKVSAAVLSGDVQVGLAGSESTVYVYAAHEEDYLINFAGLTKRDGQFIMARNKIDAFSTDNLIGKHVLVGRKGGMPALSFENALNNTGVNPKTVNMDYSVEFAALVGAFIGGNGDFVNLFEPSATKLEKEGYAYVVASVGELSGEVPYTSFYSRKSYLNDNKILLEKFSAAIETGLRYVREQDAKVVANDILKQFPDSSLTDLTTMIERHKDYDSWWEVPTIPESAFNNLLEIMIDSKQIDAYVPYNDLVSNLYKK